MIDIYARSRKILAWSLYGFFLVFGIFVASNSHSGPNENLEAQFPWAIPLFHAYGYSTPSALSVPSGNYRVCGFSYPSSEWVDGVYVPITNTFANSNTRHTWSYGNNANFYYAESCAFSNEYPLTQEDCEFEFIDGIPKQTHEYPSSWSFDSATNTCTSNFPSDSACEVGDYGDCAVECPATEWAPAGFTGHGKTCGAVGGGDTSFTDNPVADYACVGSSGLLKCDTGLNNGQTGSGAGGSHTMDDTFYKYCLENPQDVECGGTFEESPLPTCSHGGQSDPNLGCDYTLAEDTTCPAGQQLDSLGACIAVGFSMVPNAPPNPAFVGGVLGGSGSGDGDGEGDLDVSGIIDAVKDVERSVDEGNTTLEQMLEEMTDDQASGGDSCDAAPVCDGDPVGCAIVKQAWLSRCDQPEVLLQMNCGSPFICEGDSFQCVLLEQEFDAICALEDPLDGQPLVDSVVSDLSGAAVANGLGSQTMAENQLAQEANGYTALQENDLSEVFDDLDSGESVSGSCPADISFTILAGQEFTIPISTYCDFLFYIGVLIRLSAAFVGLRIVFSGIVGA